MKIPLLVVVLIVVLIVVLLGAPALGFDLPLRPGRWTLTFEGSMTGVAAMQPITLTRCLTAEDVKSIGPVPDLVGPLARGCESVEHLVEGDRIVLKFVCDEEVTIEITGQAGEESFSGSLKVYNRSHVAAEIRGTGKRVGACDTTNELDTLLGRARRYAMTENGIGVVMLEGETSGSEMAASRMISPSSISILEGLVSYLGKRKVEASHFWVRSERPDSVLYYVLKNETYGPWRIDRGIAVVEMIVRVHRAESRDTAERQVLAIMQREVVDESRLVAQYEEACHSKIRRWDLRSVDHAVMTAAFLAPAMDLVVTGAISQQLQNALSHYEKTSGQAVDRRNVVSLAEALRDIFKAN